MEKLKLYLKKHLWMLDEYLIAKEKRRYIKIMHYLELIQKRTALAMSMAEFGVIAASCLKCLKCKHKFEEKSPFATGGIVGKKDKEEIVLPNINIYRRGDN